MFISRHDGNVTTTIERDAGSGFVFAVIWVIAGIWLIHYAISWHPWRLGLLLIGALMLLLAFIVVFGPFVMIRRSRK
jgi:hypothetical protein